MPYFRGQIKTMTSFRTEIQLPKPRRQFTLEQPVITSGSCFADVIGKKLDNFKFKVCANPFGITYTPHAIHTQLHYAIHNKSIPEHTYIENNEVHHNYLFHSEFSALSKAALQQNIAEAIARAHHFLSTAKWIIITYGTAWAYTRKDTGELVANCHKMPGQLFNKELITQKRMLDSFDSLYKELKSYNPDLSILLTVSPMRHLKDTIVLNQVSKSVLRLFCHTLTEHYEAVQYFPAYEIMMDDLRDYRFYKSDMIHPSEEAEQYIWEKFIGSHCDSATQHFIETWRAIQNDLNHKPFHARSTTHRAFLTRLLEKLSALKGTVNVDHEINFVSSQLNTLLID